MNIIRFEYLVAQGQASGKSLGTFFQDEVAKPLGLDFWIGAPESVEPRIAPILAYAYKPDQARTPFMRDLANKQSIPHLFFFNNGAWRAGGANNGTGIALLELYDADSAASATAKLNNIATRGFVGTVDRIVDDLVEGDRTRGGTGRGVALQINGGIAVIVEDVIGNQNARCEFLGIEDREIAY